MIEKAKNITNPPLLMPFTDDKFFVLVRDLEYNIGTTELKVIVPKGFEEQIKSALSSNLEILGYKTLKGKFILLLRGVKTNWTYILMVVPKIPQSKLEQ